MALSPNLDPAFFPALADLGARTKTPAEWILNVFAEESRLDPSAQNSLGYTGLNQMNAPYLRARGIDPNDYRTWLASAQLTKVIAPFFVGQIAYLGRPPRSRGELYALNFYPAMVKGARVLRGSAAYAANAGLDVNKDGEITIADLDAVMSAVAAQAWYKAQAARLGSAGPGLLGGAMLVAIAAAIAYYFGR